LSWLSQWMWLSSCSTLAFSSASLASASWRTCAGTCTTVARRYKIGRISIGWDKTGGHNSHVRQIGKACSLCWAGTLGSTVGRFPITDYRLPK
jgi:hypothetical protein